MRIFSLRKSRKILFHIYHLFQRKKKKLDPSQKQEIIGDLKALEAAVQNKDREGASSYAHQCQNYSKTVLKKSSFEQIRDLVLSLAFALFVALIIRSVWFEPFEIPTGSMRPTFKEKDRLVVSKTDFGINVPFTTGHFYFDEALTRRNGTIVFTTENMDIPNSNTMDFYIIPSKKKFVKRMMGKPGDTLYFYGGQIYGIDRDGEDITPLLQPKGLEKIDHIPFIHFDGNVAVSEPFQTSIGQAYRHAIIYQMNEPIARLTLLSDHNLEGEMLSLKALRDKKESPLTCYFDLWGIKNYATTRLLSYEQAKKFLHTQDLDLEPGLLYLELNHHPNLESLTLGKDRLGRLRPKFLLNRAVIPLDKEHLESIFANLYTARFHVKNGFAMRYGAPGRSTHFLPRLDGVPDGTYEFYYGKAYEIKWGGIAKLLPKDHPLYTFSPERVQLFYNLGIDFDTRFYQDVSGEIFDTGRFAYFKEGSLHLMGAPVLQKDDPLLLNFEERQTKRREEAHPQNPYCPFVDEGPPYLSNGELDKEKIRKYGLKIPENMYLALGDNFAMSSDSRDFGFVPEGNLRGGPSFIFWPPGHRFGAPNQTPYQFFSIPSIAIWTVAVLAFILWRVWHRKRHKLPLKFDE